jgi:asparagine synthase (glutamine-hydrolysing)
MFYGVYSPQLVKSRDTQLEQLERGILCKGANRHLVEFGHFFGNILLSPRLPYTLEECVYLDQQQDIAVVLSGCIYNQSEICKKHKFDSDSIPVPKLIAKLFLLYNVDFVHQLNGDFAIAIHQPTKNTFYLFRDHLGIRPLAYTIQEQSIYFSSDIIGLSRAFHESGSLNIEYLLSDFKFNDLRQTPNKLVHKLLPGYFLMYNSDGVYTEKYWKPERIRTDYNLTRERVFLEIKALLYDAVRIRSDKRFRAGAHVSGGLDSGAVATLARKEYSSQKEFYGYSWSPCEIDDSTIEFDERKYVQKTCEWAAITPVYIPMDFEDFVYFSNNLIDNQGYFQENKILKKIQEQNINLIFSGWGGDEFISRGGHGIDWDLLFNLEWYNFFKKNPITNFTDFVGKIAFKIIFPILHILKPSVRLTLKNDARYLKNTYKTQNRRALKIWFFTPSGRKSCVGMLDSAHLSYRTEAWFMNGLKHGVEYRYPLLDKRIVEYMLKVPTKYRINDETSRIILREVTKDLLPDQVRKRRSKEDPAFKSQMDANYIRGGILFKNELNTFKENPYLSCFDFELIEHDLKIFESNKEKYNEPLNHLYTNIYSIKLAHEFIQRYIQ